jgi:hypothetical protein
LFLLIPIISTFRHIQYLMKWSNQWISKIEKKAI